MMSQFRKLATMPRGLPLEEYAKSHVYFMPLSNTFVERQSIIISLKE